MEETKKIDLSDRPIEKDEAKGWGNNPHCPTFIFGNEESADTDLGKVLEVEE